MSDCIFCKLANKEIPTQLVYEDAYMVAFHDAAPVAPVHVLLVPKTHMPNITAGAQASSEVVAHLFNKAGEIAAQLGLQEKGFRLVVNQGDDGGQTVDHLHVHLLGGRQLQWPPG